MTLLYEGKAKQVYATDNPDEVLIRFKDDATAFNGRKKDVFKGKGHINLAFTRHFFDLLEANGVKTHVISFIDEISFKSKKLQIFPLEVVIRNYAAGSVCKRLGFEKAYRFEPPLLEYFLKDDCLGDPHLCEAHIFHLKLANSEELKQIEEASLKINGILASYLDSKGIILADFKLEFGKTSNGEILLADEISPDNCRFWTKDTMESLDKDVYRENTGNLISSYSRMAEILGVQI